MPELGNFILLDASSPENVVVARLAKDGRSWADFFSEKRPALEGIFPPLEKISQGMDAPGFLFCEGPGSILGIRIAAMVVRTKLALSLSNAPKVFAFQSLSLAARLILRAFPQKKTFSIVAGSRMGRLNVLSVSGSVASARYSEIAKDELVGKVRGEVFTLPPVKNLPEGLEFSVLDAEELLRADPAVFAECPELLRDCGNTPDAVNTTTAASYAKWEPSRHGSGSGNT